MRKLLRWWSFRRLIIVSLVMSLTLSVVVIAASRWMDADEYVYTTESVPEAPVVLVLGAKVYADGSPSPFLAARLELARQLYETGKAKAVLVSGDNGQVEYNEVDPMRQWLTDRGLPEEHVIGDYAGFDTYDSCVRAAEVFGVESMIVVTQSFHLERAITLCQDAGIDTVGVGDDSVSRYARAWKWAATREYGANVKAMWDLISGREPVFLGPHETSVDDALRGRLAGLSRLNRDD